MPTHRGRAQWKGDLHEGSGTANVAGHEVRYSHASRFKGEGPGTSPEALIGSAHAACFAMAFSNELSKAGATVHEMDVRAEVRLSMTDDGPLVDRILLTARGRVEGIDAEAFQRIGEAAKKGCPVSKALAAVPEIALDAALVD